MKKLNIICLSLLMACPLAVFAQEDETTQEETATKTVIRKTKKQEPTRIIKGRVISQDRKLALPGVLIQSVAGQGYSCLTEEDGTFSMPVPLYSSAVKVTIPGYNTIRVGLNAEGELGDIVMLSDHNTALYGDDDNIQNHAGTSNLEFSTVRVASDEIANQLGSVVRSVHRSGAIAQGNYMSIGGVNSLQSNAQPLVVLDGVIINQQYNRDMLHSGYYNDILANINVNDIEDVQVLSNGTALYGSKGANGVILINTKRSKSLATRIDANISLGVELLPKQMDVMNGIQFKNYASGLLQSTGTNATNFKFLNPNPKYYYYNKFNNNTDWGKEVYERALTQNYALSVQGGGEAANYMLSLGYTKDNSMLKENNLDRLNIRFNTDIKLIEQLTIKFDAAYTNQTRKLVDMGTPLSYDDRSITSANFLASAKSPMLSPYTFAMQRINSAHLDITDEDYLDEVSQLANANYRLANPSAVLEYGEGQNKNYFDNSYVNIAFTPTYHAPKNIDISSMFSYTGVNTNEIHYVPVSGVPSYYVAALQATMENEMASQYGKQNTINSDTRIKWGQNFKGHDVKVLGGFRLIRESYSLNTQHGYNTGGDKTPNIGNTSNRTSGGINEKWMDLSYYLQGQYNYRNRYFAEFNASMESNSQFGRDTKDGVKIGGISWGIFAAGQLGWVVSNEKWFKAKGINYLKLTVGAGTSGNDNIAYDAFRSYRSSFLFLNRVSSLSISNIGNTELQWETTKRMNAGIELNAINNRLGVKFNYFKSWTDNLLTFQELGFLSGLDKNWSNGGKIENEGFDVAVNATLLSRKNWNWGVHASMGHTVNKVTELPDNKQYLDTEICGGTVRSAVGNSINTFYGFRTNGVYATTEEAKADGKYIVDNTGKRTYFGAGDVRFVDINGDGEINDKDRTVIGDATPDIYGNFGTTLSWKNLTLDVNFNYSLGGDVYNYNRRELESGSRFMNQTTAMLNRWTHEGQVTDVPKATYGDPMGNSRFSDRWIEDASYLRLKTITLSYKLPINNTYIQGISIWAQANNVATFTKYLGTDPEFSMNNSVLSQGIDCGYLPQARNFLMGVKINL